MATNHNNHITREYLSSCVNNMKNLHEENEIIDIYRLTRSLRWRERPAEVWTHQQTEWQTGLRSGASSLALTEERGTVEATATLTTPLSASSASREHRILTSEIIAASPVWVGGRTTVQVPEHVKQFFGFLQLSTYQSVSMTTVSYTHLTLPTIYSV